jgi:LPS sulfotransferase NodH
MMADALHEYAEWVLRPGIPDQPVQPSASYFVCGTPRCGSWLLCGLLASTGIAGRPHEWFWRDTEEANRRAWAVSDFSHYLACVRAAGTTPNGVFGAKLMWRQIADLIVRLKRVGDASSPRALFQQQFPKPCFIWIRREDIVAQAVSWARAIRTGQWHHWDTPSPEAPEYDGEQIDALTAELAADNAGWGNWFATNEIEPFTIGFEDLVADPDNATRDVLRFLEIDADDVSIGELTVRTSDQLNEEWLRRYRS